MVTWVKEIYELDETVSSITSKFGILLYVEILLYIQLYLWKLYGYKIQCESIDRKPEVSTCKIFEYVRNHKLLHCLVGGYFNWNLVNYAIVHSYTHTDTYVWIYSCEYTNMQTNLESDWNRYFCENKTTKYGVGCTLVF